jgi:hypothetical protein
MSSSSNRFTVAHRDALRNFIDQSKLCPPGGTEVVLDYESHWMCFGRRGKSPLSDGSADLVVLVDTLLADPRLSVTLKEAFRIAKPDGVVVLAAGINEFEVLPNGGFTKAVGKSARVEKYLGSDGYQMYYILSRPG